MTGAEKVGGPTVKLNSGYEMPLIGLGTWQSKPGEVEEACKVALETGYRHLDCAYCYDNEPEVGRAITAKIADGTVKREDIFITGKLWNTHHAPERVEAALKLSLEALQVDYLDMYLIHWPLCTKFISWEERFPKDPENPGRLLEDHVDLLETWKAMEACVEKGLIKSIGLSNFNIKQMDYISSGAKIPIANLQVEVHPYFQQKALQKYCAEKGIAISCYSPLGSPARPGGMQRSNQPPPVMEDKVLAKVAEAHGKAPQSVGLRFLMQSGLIVLPKSVTASRIKDNLHKVLDFELSKDEMAEIQAIDKDFRLCIPMIEDPANPGKWMFRDGFFKEFPFKDEEEKLNAGV